jgi:hypothetical protein
MPHFCFPPARPRKSPKPTWPKHTRPRGLGELSTALSNKRNDNHLINGYHLSNLSVLPKDAMYFVLYSEILMESNSSCLQQQLIQLTLTMGFPPYLPHTLCSLILLPGITFQTKYPYLSICLWLCF